MPKSALGQALKRSLDLQYGYTESLSWSQEAKDLMDAYAALLLTHEQVEDALLGGPAWADLRGTLDALSLEMKALEDVKVSNKSTDRALHRQRIAAAQETADGLLVAAAQRLGARQQERRRLTEGLLKHVAALEDDPCANTRAINSLRANVNRLAEAADLEASIAHLGELTPEIDRIGAAAQAFLRALTPLRQRGAALKDRLFNELLHKALDELFVGLDKAARTERGGVLGEGTRRLESIAKELSGLESEHEEEAAAQADYGPLRASLIQDREGFTARSECHAAYSKGLSDQIDSRLERAGIEAENGDFRMAIGRLVEARETLDEWDRVANEKLSKQLGEQQAQQALLAKRQLAEQQRQAAEAAQALAEAAVSDTALTAIGRDRKFNAWLNKVDQLRQAGLITLALQPRRDLAGGTVEFKIFVNGVHPSTFRDNFVVHYHPDASGSSVGHPWASQMHAKPHRGNASTSRVYMSNDHWLVTAGIAPRRQDVR